MKKKEQQKPILIREGFKIELVLKYEKREDGTFIYYNPIDVTEQFFKLKNEIDLENEKIS